MHPLEILSGKQQLWWLGLPQRTALQACCNNTLSSNSGAAFTRLHNRHGPASNTRHNIGTFPVYKCILGWCIYRSSSGLTDKRQQNKRFILKMLKGRVEACCVASCTLTRSTMALLAASDSTARYCCCYPWINKRI